MRNMKKKGAKLRCYPGSLLLMLSMLFVQLPIATAATPKEVLIIINDASSTSKAIGVEYAHKRNVTNILHVRCSDSALSQQNETIGIKDYLSQIETPLRAFLGEHSSINFIVTTKGIPLRISGADIGEGFSGTMETSLDSYLAALDYGKLPGAVKVQFNAPKDGAVGTAWENRYWNARTPFTHAQFGGYLVTRLDGYSLVDAQNLTTHALSAEKRLGDGNILLDVEPDFGLGNKSSQPAPIPGTPIKTEDPWNTWNADMLHARDDLAARKIPVELDLNKSFVGNRNNLLGYFSWGSNDDHYSQAAYNSLSFLPGAIGDTAVSTSARSFFPQKNGQSMIADLVAQGITGVKGYTDEPLLQAIASPTIVLDRYTSGYTLAESFYAGSHFVGWTDVVIGDPLTHPYQTKTKVASRKSTH
jgi:uncharacterized protein (TIGR03790 family)